MMTINYSAIKSDLDLLDDQESNIKEALKELASKTSKDVYLDSLTEVISNKLEMEEKIMEKIGLSLTPVHQDEHKKLLKELILLEFSWKAKRISDDVYVKSINYKLEFHDHYFDQAQRLLLFAGNHEH